MIVFLILCLIGIGFGIRKISKADRFHQYKCDVCKQPRSESVTFTDLSFDMNVSNATENFVLPLNLKACEYCIPDHD